MEWAWGDKSRPHIRVTFKGNENKTQIGKQAASVTDLKKPTMYLGDVKSEPGKNEFAKRFYMNSVTLPD